MNIKQKVTAFTLIELLVVIVIIGILSGMGIAQFNNYIEKAQLAKAQAAAAQFKSLALAENAVREDKLFTAWYDFENDFNSTNQVAGSINDKSSSKNHINCGNCVNLSQASGQNSPNSLQINNKNYYIHPSSIQNSPKNKITIASWVKARNTSTLGIASLVYFNNNFRLGYLGKKIIFNVMQGSSNIDANKAIKEDQWYFVTASFYNNTASIWINGELVAQETTQNLSPSAQNQTFLLGWNHFLNVDIDDLMIIPYGFDGEKFY